MIEVLGNATRLRNGLRVGPNLHTVTGAQSKANYVMNNYNSFRNLYITGCYNAIEMECGPSVDGGDSGCWYNSFNVVLIEYSDRGRDLAARLALDGSLWRQPQPILFRAGRAGYEHRPSDRRRRYKPVLWLLV